MTRQILDPLRQAGIELKRQRRTAKCLDRRPRMIRGEVESFSRRRELLAPIRPKSFALRSGQSGPLPTCVIGILRFQSRKAGGGAISRLDVEFEEFLDQQRE